MLRGDNIICGTTTTGTTSPLVLAATPVPPGGIDFDVFARGIGFANSAAIPVSYTLIEFTDNTYATAKQHEKANGTLTLGGSSGITNATLTRGVGGFQSTATSLNAQPATQNFGGTTAITIGTAANCLVFIGPSAAEIPAYSPYANIGNSLGDDLGAAPMAISLGLTNLTLANNTFYYWNFMWGVPMLVKRASINVRTAYSGGVPVSNAWVRLYDTSTTGIPGKLLYNFGLLGTAGTSLNSAVPVSTLASGNGFPLTPGDYWICLAVAISGGSAGPAVDSYNQPFSGGRIGTNTGATGSFSTTIAFTVTGTPSGTPDDPAVTPTGTPTSGSFCFQLKAS